MNVKIDEATCIGCGLCASLCPEVFEMDGDKAKVKKKNGGKGCKEIADDCPVQAIKIS